MAFDMVTRRRQLKPKQHRLVYAHRHDALEPQSALAEVDEDGAVIRAELHISQNVKSAARVKPAPDLQQR